MSIQIVFLIYYFKMFLLALTFGEEQRLNWLNTMYLNGFV